MASPFSDQDSSDDSLERSTVKSNNNIHGTASERFCASLHNQLCLYWKLQEDSIHKSSAPQYVNHTLSRAKVPILTKSSACLELKPAAVARLSRFHFSKQDSKAKFTQNALITISKAIELFVCEISTSASYFAEEQNLKNIDSTQVAQALTTRNIYDFLYDNLDPQLHQRAVSQPYQCQSKFLENAPTLSPSEYKTLIKEIGHYIAQSDSDEDSSSSSSSSTTPVASSGPHHFGVDIGQPQLGSVLHPAYQNDGTSPEMHVSAYQLGSRGKS